LIMKVDHGELGEAGRDDGEGLVVSHEAAALFGPTDRTHHCLTHPS
jgi:hypothetical protein